MELRRELVNPDLEWLAAMDQVEFKRRFAGSPLERTKRKRLLRNVAIAMGNSGDTRFIERLRRWAEPPPGSVAEDPLVTDAARWALERLQTLRQPSSSPVLPSS